MHKRKILSISIIIVFIICMVKLPSGNAVIPGPGLDWWPLPPYNTLWPLWSPLLSPPNALGIPVPIVSSLAPDTVLPVQPGLTWDSNYDYPWLLYDTPLGMVYYDPLFGIDLWPPDYLVSPFGVPLPINLSLIPGLGITRHFRAMPAKGYFCIEVFTIILSWILSCVGSLPCFPLNICRGQTVQGEKRVSCLHNFCHWLLEYDTSKLVDPRERQ